MEVARVLPQSKLGVFDDACRDFVEQVINLDGVLAVGAKLYLGHVDIWTITRNYDYELILPGGKLPKDYTVIYEVGNANRLM